MSEKIKTEDLIDINILEKFVIQINDNGQINKLSEFTNNQNIIKKEHINKNIKKKSSKNKIEFVSISRDSRQFMTEHEIFSILNVNKKGITKRTGKHQEKLYHHYILARKEKDKGYLVDVMEKIITFKENIKEATSLMKNKAFMKVWRKNYGSFTPIQLLKNTGNFKTINIIKELI